MLFELATLSCPLLSLSAAAAPAWAAAPDASGQLMACCRTDIGTLGRVLVLRGFDTQDALAAECRRAFLDVKALIAGSIVTALSMESYAPFRFCRPSSPGRSAQSTSSVSTA